MDEEHLRWVSAVLVSGVAAAYDLRSGHIPNGVVALGLALAAAAAGVAVAGGDGLQALMRGGAAVVGFLACGAVPLLLYRLDGLGGGDVKLLATLGALLGPTLGLELSFGAFGVATLCWPVRLARVHAARRASPREDAAPGAAAARRVACGTSGASDSCGARRPARPGSGGARLAIAFAPCAFVAALVLTTLRWSS